MKAKVFTDSDGVFHDFNYETVEGLFNDLNDFISKKYPLDDDIIITLENGTKYYWESAASHYYYGKGRISFEEMLNYMKGDKL